jgi:hypothetical protein
MMGTMSDDSDRMRYRPVPGSPTIHRVPRPEITIQRAAVTITLDDAGDHRHSFVFSPYQAVRVTTQDCFLAPPDSGFRKDGVFVVEDSPWIAELKSALAQVDRLATFLERSHHFVVPSGDDIVEVVAWEVRWNGPAGMTFPT